MEGDNGGDGDDQRGTKQRRTPLLDPYESEAVADERELNPPEEEPDTRPDPYA